MGAIFCKMWGDSLVSNQYSNRVEAEVKFYTVNTGFQSCFKRCFESNTNHALLYPYRHGWRNLFQSGGHKCTLKTKNIFVVRIGNCDVTSIEILGHYLYTIWRSKLHFFELLSEWELSIGLNFKSNVLYKSIASKNIQSDINYASKNT